MVKLKARKEVRTVGRGAYEKRLSNILIVEDGKTIFEVHDWPQHDGGYKDHILVHYWNDGIVKWAENNGYSVHKPYDKGHIDIYPFSPQKVHDAVESVKRQSKCIEIIEKIIASQK
jgi:hypothetical protein